MAARDHPGETPPAVETRGLGRSFDGHVAVDAIDLVVRRGETFALLGPNGAGKTTTVRMLACLLRPTDGTARVLGRDVVAEPGAIRARVGLLTEAPGLYDRLSAEQVLVFFARLYGLADPLGVARTQLRRFDLWEHRDRPTGGLSKGMKQKVALARALFHEPELLFLDEPTSGLDVPTARRVRELIAELTGQGRTVIMTTHDLDDAERLADRVAILDRRLLAADTPAELRRRYFAARFRVRFATLGDDPGKIQTPVSSIEEVPGIRRIEFDGETLAFDADDPEHQVPEVVRRLAAAGAPIMGVEESRPDLEEVYLRVVGRTPEVGR